MNAFTLAYLARVEVWGLAAALLQGLMLLMSWRAWARATASSGPVLRHRLAGAHFAALLLAPIATVVVLHGTVAQAGAGAPSGPGGRAPLWIAGHAGMAWLAVILAGLWSAGAAVMLLRLGLEARRLARLPRRPAPAALAGTVRRLAAAAGVAVPDVRLADIAAPQVVGARRAILLVPRDLMDHLPPAERDAVLLHELAHVRRGDFACNLVQRLVLALLWFQPAAWALYAELAREREACCDALAVRHGATASGLARALVRLAEGRGRAGLAMAISGTSDLGVRVRRLLGVDPAARASASAWLGAVAASALCLAALAAGRLGPLDPALGELCAASVFGPTISIAAHDPAGTFALRVRQGRVIAAAVDRRPLPRARILQVGDRVTLVGARREPILALTVSPQGRIRWEPRV